MSPAGNRYLLTVIDEYSRFPFAIPLKDICAQSVIRSLKSIFSLCGTPGFIHSDRGTQFMSADFDKFCADTGIAHSRTTPYNPKGNGQCERLNGTVWKGVVCTLHFRGLQPDRWEDILPDVLASIRALICTSTQETPHERFFGFKRRAPAKWNLPSWLAPGHPVYVKSFVRNKGDPIVQPAEVVEPLNNQFTRIRRHNGAVDTVSSSMLSRGSVVPNPRRRSSLPHPVNVQEKPQEGSDVIADTSIMDNNAQTLETLAPGSQQDVCMPRTGEESPPVISQPREPAGQSTRHSGRVRRLPECLRSTVDSSIIPETFDEDEIICKYEEQH